MVNVMLMVSAVLKKSKWNMTWLLNELQLMGYSYTETSAGYALEKYR